MIIFSHKSGQLGNRLFSFAHLIAHAKANDLRLINLAFDEYAQYFQSTSKDIFCRFPQEESIIRTSRFRSFFFFVNKLALKILRITRVLKSPFHSVIVADLPHYSFNGNEYFDLNEQSFTELAKQKPMVFLFGRFFRDFKNFQKYQNTVRSYFTPVHEIEARVTSLIEKCKADSDLVIGVHIRRGDYALFADGKYFYSPAQYLEKMKQLQNCMPNKRIKFLICSNDNVEFNDSVIRIQKATGHVVEDMYALSKCDLIIGPPSTYSLWASFYGHKPLCQLTDLTQELNISSFKILPPEVLYNFSFN
jgi:hypothetical protein